MDSNKSAYILCKPDFVTAITVAVITAHLGYSDFKIQLYDNIVDFINVEIAKEYDDLVIIDIPVKTPKYIDKKNTIIINNATTNFVFKKAQLYNTSDIPANPLLINLCNFLKCGESRDSVLRAFALFMMCSYNTHKFVSVINSGNSGAAQKLFEMVTPAHYTNWIKRYNIHIMTLNNIKCLSFLQRDDMNISSFEVRMLATMLGADIFFVLDKATLTYKALIINDKGKFILKSFLNIEILDDAHRLGIFDYSNQMDTAFCNMSKLFIKYEI